MHTAGEIGVDDFQASRAPDDRYRTSPLKGLWTHTKGGFLSRRTFREFDGRGQPLRQLQIATFDGPEKKDLVEYLKSL